MPLEAHAPSHCAASASAFGTWLGGSYAHGLVAPSQRGKGAFYLGVGILVCFMSPDNSVFGVNNIAAIVLAIVGGLHT